MARKHPKGLGALFATEMWERLGFYLMLGILYLYIIDAERGGLGLSNLVAGEIYGTYLAFVYFTPFVGGMVADRILGFRRSVLIGGLVMAAGYFCLGVRSLPFFFSGLALLCIGNGLFKPNVSAMVGNLYEPGDPRRDSGFNVFYMGINIGASLSALVAALLRNLWSFNTAFTAAGFGLLIGCAILVLNWKTLAVTDVRSEVDENDMGMGEVFFRTILPAAFVSTLAYFLGRQLPFVTRTIGPVTFAFLVGMLPILVYFALLVRRSSAGEKPGLAALVPVFVAGCAFATITSLSGGLMTAFAEHRTDRRADWIPAAAELYAQKAMPSFFFNADGSFARPDPRTLVVVGADVEAMFGVRTLSRSVARQLRDDAGLGLELVAPASVARGERFLACGVFPDEVVRVAVSRDAGATTTVRVEPDTTAALETVVVSRRVDGRSIPVLLVSQATFDAVYARAGTGRPTLAPGRYLRLVNAEMITGFLAPVFVVLLTPVLVVFFGWRVRLGKPVGTARKIFLGLVITAGALLVVAAGAAFGRDGADKASMLWLVAYYVVITVGELCLEPMGLSLVTVLSPRRLVGLMMGLWFLAAAIGNKLSGFLSGLEPTAAMFGILAAAILGVAGFIYPLLPRLEAASKRCGG